MSRQSPAKTKKPREITGRMVLFTLIGFFGVIFTVNAVLLQLAASTFGGLETESSYRAGLAYKNEIETAHIQDQRGWNVEAALKRQSDSDVLVEAIVHDANGQVPQRLVATARLAHPADTRRDQDLILNEENAGTFRGHADAAAGQWDLIIDFTRDGERLFRSKSRVTLR
jgi:nitrogen fixation protein FixH